MPVGLFSFRQQHAERRQLIVPFDQRRHRADACQYLFVELPHGVIDGRTVVIDQQAVAQAVSVFGETGQMNFTHGVQRQGIDLGEWVELVVDARHVDVVHIQQQAAPGTANDLAYEIGLFQG